MLYLFLVVALTGGPIAIFEAVIYALDLPAGPAADNTVPCMLGECSKQHLKLDANALLGSCYVFEDLCGPLHAQFTLCACAPMLCMRMRVSCMVAVHSQPAHTSSRPSDPNSPATLVKALLMVRPATASSQF